MVLGRYLARINDFKILFCLFVNKKKVLNEVTLYSLLYSLAGIDRFELPTLDWIPEYYEVTQTLATHNREKICRV